MLNPELEEGQTTEEQISSLYDGDINGKEYVSQIMRKYTKVNFIPKKEDSQFMDLEPGDYEYIHGVLSQIERGVWIPSEPNVYRVQPPTQP